MATNGTPEQSNDAPQRDQPSGSGFSISGKTLGIAGGGAAALVVVIVAVVLFATGAFGGGGGVSGGGNILAYIPGDAGTLIILDNQAILDGNVPEDLVEYFQEAESSGGLDDFPDSFDDLDVNDDDVATIAFVADKDQNDMLVIVQGDFEFDVIREDLEDGADCEDDDYRGFELWECPGGGAAALFEKDGYLVFVAEQRQDDLERLLTYKSRTPEKLADADDSDIKGILSRTGGGWLQVVYLLEDCVIERCEGIAIAAGEGDDSDSIPASYTVMFSSERAAAASEGDVAIDDLLEGLFAIFGLDLEIGEVKADGEFVVGSGTAEFLDPDDAGSRSSGSGGGGDGHSAANVGVSTTPRQAAPAAPPTNTPVPAPPAVLTARTANSASAAPRPDWIDDCVQEALHSINKAGGVRPDLREQHEEEITQSCGCTYDYLTEYWGSDPPLVSAPPDETRFDHNSWMEYLEMQVHAINYCRESRR